VGLRKILYIMIVAFLLLAFTPVVFADYNEGWLHPVRSYVTGSVPAGIAIGDINNDGRKDVVVLNESNLIHPHENDFKLIVFIQNTSGELMDPVKYDTNIVTTTKIHQSIGIADIDSDGLNDVIIRAEGGIGVYFQNTSKTLDAMVLIPLTHGTPTTIRVGDVNNDSLPDVVADTFGAGSSHLELLMQDGGGNLTLSSVIDTDAIANDIEIGDVNNDHINDIVTMRQADADEVAVYLQSGATPGTFAGAAYYDMGPASLALSPGEVVLGDVNNDGRSDVVVSNHNDGRYSFVGIYLQNNAGTLNAMVTYKSLAYPEALLIGDANRDGFKDILVAHSGLGTIGLFTQSDLTHGMNVEQYYGSWPTTGGFALGDVNFDGKDDVVVAMSNLSMIGVHWGWDGTYTISVTAPTKAEVLTVGQEYIVRWTVIGFTTHVNIDYSIDGGNNWIRIVSFRQNGDERDLYRWIVPFTPSTNCKLVVHDADGFPVGEPSRVFTIADDGVPRITVLAPNGAEEWSATHDYNIRWSTTGTVGNVKIEYTVDAGANWTEIIGSTPNDGTYTWNVPDSLSTQCKVRVSEAADSDPIDSSDANFSIVSATTPTINLTAPNGGESLTGGAVYPITWNYTGAIFNVKLEYSTNNGASWNIISSAAPNTGTYSWSVPNTPASQCLVRVSDASDSVPTDTSNAVFSISSGGSGGDAITVTMPNGGEAFFAGLQQNILWTSSGAIGNVKIEYSTNNSTSWTTIVSSTANNGFYSWAVPNTPSTQCKVRVSRVAGTPLSDTSDAVFSILVPQPSVVLLSPMGGERWQTGSVHNIIWQSYLTVGALKLEYSTNNKSSWTTIIASTPNDGSYSWTVPNVVSNNCYIRISEAGDGIPTYTNYQSFAIVSDNPNPTISLSRKELFFATVKSSSAQTPTQKVIVNNSGNDILKWTATVSADWFRINAFSGTQSGILEVTVHTVGLAVGTYTGTVTVASTNAVNSPQTVAVTLRVYPANSDAEPIGSMDTPEDGATVMSSIPVTGWAVDDIGIEKVSLWRDAVANEGSGMVFIGDGVMVDGARPDLEAAFPGYPMNYQAGWGYMLLTNMLPDGGNGTFTLHAYAQDYFGHKVYLGKKTIYCDNKNAVKPFGAIDTPVQGGTASGRNYRNQGWVLTPWPNKIPIDGSTLDVYIDGVSIGKPKYNIFRGDIASLFPNFANSLGSLAYFDFDTTVYANGVHTIQWLAIDNAGNMDGVGSRYFTCMNSGYARGQSQVTSATGGVFLKEIVSTDTSGPIKVRTGYDVRQEAMIPTVDKEGIVRITIREMERLVLELGGQVGYGCTGYLQVGTELRQLPVGSTLDAKNGIYYWQPGVGFIGDYRLVFVGRENNGKTAKQTVLVTIKSKFAK